MKKADGLPSVLSSIRNTLQIDCSDLYSQPSSMQAFGLLRGAVESIGVFVLLKGDLGSYHTAIDLQTFRGFALADRVAPFVVINDQDSRAAWSFTLVHELTHLWLGQTGVSGDRAELAIERFCNDVAGEFLLPKEELGKLSIDSDSGIEAMEREVSEFARKRNLSGSMVAYSLYRFGFIDRDDWSRLRAVFHEHWLEERRKQRERARERDDGPSFYSVRGHRVGKGLLALVDRMMRAGALTTSKAAKVLGVKAKQVQSLLETSGSREMQRSA
jgi:Zn-dependent peptidase ImmA (M78 family)